MSIPSIQPPSNSTVPLTGSEKKSTLQERIQSVTLEILVEKPHLTLSEIQPLTVQKLKIDDSQTQHITTMVANLLKDLRGESLSQAMKRAQTPLEFNRTYQLTGEISSLFKKGHLNLEALFLRLWIQKIQEEPEVAENFQDIPSEDVEKILTLSKCPSWELNQERLTYGIKTAFQDLRKLFQHFFDLIKGNKPFSLIHLTICPRVHSRNIWNRFSKDYRRYSAFFLQAQHRDDSSDGQTQRLIDLPPSSFSSFFMNNQEEIYVRAFFQNIRITLDHDFLFQEFKNTSFEDSNSLKRRVSDFLNNPTVQARARLYTDYKTSYPGVRHDKLFDILWERKKQNPNLSNREFLEIEERREAETLIDLLYEKKMRKKTNISKLFHSSNFVSHTKRKISKDLEAVKSYLRKSDLKTLEAIWDQLKGKCKTIGYRHCMEIVLEQRQCNQRIKNGLSNKTDPYIKDLYENGEVQRFQETLKPDDNIEEVLELFLKSSNRKAAIFRSIQDTQESYSNPNAYINQLQLSLEQIQKDSTEDELSIMHYEMNRVVLLDLLGFHLIQLEPGSDLEKRRNDLIKILKTVNSCLKNNALAPQAPKLEVLSMGEYRQALYLAFIYQLTKNRMIDKYTKKKSELKNPQSQDKINEIEKHLHKKANEVFLNKDFILSTIRDILVDLHTDFGNSLPRKTFSSKYFEIQYFIKNLICNYQAAEHRKEI